jgi:hypothetical protein
VARRAVLAVADDDEQCVVDSHAQADQSGDRDGGCRHLHRAGQQGDATDARADPDDREPDRHDCGHEGAEHDDQDEECDEEPDADVARVVLGLEEDGVATELDLHLLHLQA